MAMMKLGALRDVISGRSNQSVDARQVSYYLELLMAGQKFETDPTVTTDGVIIDGRHRIEAYRQFYEKNPRLDVSAVQISVTVKPVVWDKADAASQNRLRDLAFLSNFHKKGKAASFEDLKHAVKPLLFEEELSDDAIVGRLAPVPAKMIRKAILAARESLNQTRLSNARRAMNSGMPIKKALAEAGLPADTNLDPRPLHDRNRFNKIVKESRGLAAKWYSLYGRSVDRFNTGDLTQEQLLTLAKCMQTAAATLTRKADSVHRQALDHINKTASRLRTAVAAQ